MNLEQLWQSTLGEMEIQLSQANFATWLKNSRLVDKKEGTFYIALPNNFAKEWVANKYHKNILGVLRSLDDSAKKLEFTVGNNPINTAASSKKTSPVLVDELNQFEDAFELNFKVDPVTNLNTKYTLQSFVVGPSNELAFAAATAVVQEVGTKYNPLFIYGGV